MRTLGCLYGVLQRFYGLDSRSADSSRDFEAFGNIFHVAFHALSGREKGRIRNFFKDVAANLNAVCQHLSLFLLSIIK